MAMRAQVKELGGLSEGLTSSSRTASDPWLERFLLSEALRLSFHFWPFVKSALDRVSHHRARSP